MSEKQYHCASDPENRNDILDAEMLRGKLKRATDAQLEDAMTCRADAMQQNSIKNKLVIHHINGTNTEVNITPSQAASIAADIKDRCEKTGNKFIASGIVRQPEDMTLEVECSMSDEAFKELFKDKLSKLMVLSVCHCPRCLLERRIDQPPSFKHKEIAFKDRIIGFCPKCGWEALYGGETAQEAANGWNQSIREFSEMLYEKLTKEAQEKNK